MKRFLPGCILLLLSPSWAMAGTKEEIVRLQSDVLQLQNHIRLLQKTIDENSGVVKSLLEQLNDQVAKSNLAMSAVSQALQAQKADAAASLAQVRQDIQNLTVKWDDTNQRIAALHEKFEESQMRLSTLREVPSIEEGAAVEPDQVYSAAYNDYLMGNYDLAIAGFQDFLTNYRDSELADNALYYMGVAHQNLGRYEPAIQTFDQVVNLYPKSDKAANSYYKKALVLQQLQKNEEAIQAFRKLIALYPDAHEATMAKQELEKLGVSPTESPRRRRD